MQKLNMSIYIAESVYNYKSRRNDPTTFKKSSFNEKRTPCTSNKRMLINVCLGNMLTGLK